MGPRVCIPGVFCIEHFTIFLLFVLVIVVTYLFQQKNGIRIENGPSTFVIPTPLATMPSDVITVSSSDRSIYTPPVKMEYPMMMSMATRPTGGAFSQMGILTRRDNGDILPLMGRRMSRDRYNYYTMSTTNAINSKLPVRVKGKSGTNEYGCDELFCGDQVFVSGYNAGFDVTLYDNGMYVYS